MQVQVQLEAAAVVPEVGLANEDRGSIIEQPSALVCLTATSQARPPDCLLASGTQAGKRPSQTPWAHL